MFFKYAYIASEIYLIILVTIAKTNLELLKFCLRLIMLKDISMMIFGWLILSFYIDSKQPLKSSKKFKFPHSNL